MLKLTAEDLPFQVPISIKIGESFESPLFVHKTSAGVEIDTSSWTITAELREKLEVDSDIIDEFTVSKDGNGYYLTLTDAETDEFDEAAAFYGIRVDTGAEVTAYFGGTATIRVASWG